MLLTVKLYHHNLNEVLTVHIQVYEYGMCVSLRGLWHFHRISMEPVGLLLIHGNITTVWRL